MKKITYLFSLFFLISLTNKINAFELFSNNENKYFIEHIENFISINKNCNLCMVNRQSNAGCVISNNENKILLVKDKITKKWWLPGGMKEKDETAIMTAVRETLNKTGYLVYIDDFISEFKNGFRLYKCKIIKQIPRTDKKIIEFKWVDKKELEEMLKKENRHSIRMPNELDLIYGKFDWILK